jgi:hypothetical protein
MNKWANELNRQFSNEELQIDNIKILGHKPNVNQTNFAPQSS